MLNIDRFSGIPVYQQIVEQFKRLIAAGALRPEEVIPSVRALSMELSVNPNTVQKAYAELEQSGITASVPGVGRFVARNARELLREYYAGQLRELAGAVAELAAAGVPEEQVLKAVKSAYGGASLEGEEGNGND